LLKIKEEDKKNKEALLRGHARFPLPLFKYMGVLNNVES
jgi:hypothetical protein